MLNSFGKLSHTCHLEGIRLCFADDDYYCDCVEGTSGDVCDRGTVDWVSCLKIESSQVHGFFNDKQGNSTSKSANSLCVCVCVCVQSVNCSWVVPEILRCALFLDSDCDINPCENGGTCVPDPTGNSPTCDCLTGYSGDNCENGTHKRCTHTLHFWEWEN